MLELAGRFDDQVKVRGFRVDPVEVESVLATHPAVRLVRVCADRNDDGDRTLTAFYTLTDRHESDAGARRAELRRFLAQRLPPFMVPADYVLLDRMPLTPAGKIDRRQLPSTEPQLRRRIEVVPAADGSAAADGAAPRERQPMARRTWRRPATGRRSSGARCSVSNRSATATTSSSWAATPCC